jgi:hypothetical protein
MSGDDVVSAIPGELISWSGWASGLNTDLERSARDLNQKLEELNFSHPDPGYLGQVPYLGNDVIRYAYRNDGTDTWVGRVGHAFMRIATRGQPHGVVAADYQDFLNGLVTTDQQDLAGLVGANPVTDAEARAAAAALAEQLKEAQDAGDLNQVQDLVRQLRDHQWDPNFTSTFFQSLGVPQTLAVLRTIAKDDGLLRIYDNALATATNSPDWDPAFNDQMWPQPGSGWQSTSPIEALILKYGVFSDDFLTRAGDSVLFGGRNAWTRAHDPTVDQLVLNALARSPSASLSFLLGHPVDPEIGQPSFGDRLVLLLHLLGQEFPGSPDVARAFGGLLSASGHSPMALTPFVGPSGTEPAIQALLHQLGAQPKGLIPDGARSGIADLISQHIELFVDAPLSKDGSATWQQSVFDLAEQDGNDQVLQDSIRKIEAAALSWSLTHMPSSENPTDNANERAWMEWDRRTGTLFALAGMPLSQVNYDRSKLESDRAFVIDQAIYLALAPGGAWTVPAEDAASWMVDSWMHNGNPLNSSDPGLANKAKDDQVFLNKLADMKAALAAGFLQAHPELVPPGVNRDDFLRRVASGEDTGNAVLSQFQKDLNGASLAFAEQYFFPNK